jgi:hypothetical protein
MSKRSAPLSKADLLKPKIRQIDVDESYVTIRAMSAEYALSLRGKDLQSADIFAVIAESIVDEAGAPLLTGDEVGKMAITTLEQIIKGVFAFNALGDKAVEEAVAELKKTEDLTTNSPAS